MGYQFEFDSANRLLLIRIEGKLSNELLGECYDEIRKRAVATDALLGIFDLSGVTQYTVSSEFVRQLAGREPAMPHASNRMRVIVVEDTTGFGLARMFQIVGEKERPKFHVVRTFDDALAVLGVQSPQFEPLQ